MQHKIETMFRQEVQDFLEATKPSKCLLAYHSVSIGQFLFQNIGVEVDMTAGAFVVVVYAAFTICFSPFACSSHMNDSDRTYVYE